MEQRGTLLRTKEGDLDLSWVLLVAVAVSVLVGFLAEVLLGKRASPWAWGTMTGIFAGVLVAAVPIAKARLLARHNVVGQAAAGVMQAPEFGGSTEGLEPAE